MKDYLMTVQHNRPIGGHAFELKLFSNDPLPDITPGQFLHLEVPYKNAILRRPFCIYKWGTNHVSIAVDNKGKGTDSLSKITDGQQLKAILPLGNGFVLPDEWKRIVIVGGGIGCAPLFGIMPHYKDKEFFSYLGFKSKNYVMFEEDFSKWSKVVISTFDGSYGLSGYQVAALERDIQKIMPDAIITCGSRSMLLSVKAFAEKYRIPALVTTEQRMACGVGACLGCTCRVTNKNGEIENKRVCMDGPVFYLKDLIL